MIEFRQKNFGILSDTVTGAALGGTVAGTGALFRNKFYKGDQAHENNQSLFRSDLFLTTSGIVIGAALGALVGGIKEIATKVNRRNTVDRRLMSKVVEILKKDGLKEGTNYTKDPKTASSLKTKVCVVISKVSGELRISVNLVSDPKLKTVSDEIIKRLPNTSATTEKMSDKFNDIVITSVSDGSADAGLVAGVIEKYVHSGYPVYLVEVG
jgi:hypothetical protein